MTDFYFQYLPTQWENVQLEVRHCNNIIDFSTFDEGNIYSVDFFLCSYFAFFLNNKKKLTEQFHHSLAWETLMEY